MKQKQLDVTTDSYNKLFLLPSSSSWIPHMSDPSENAEQKMMLPEAGGEGGFQSEATMDGSVDTTATPTHSVSKGVTFYQLILQLILNSNSDRVG